MVNWQVVAAVLVRQGEGEVHILPTCQQHTGLLRLVRRLGQHWLRVATPLALL